MERFALSLFRFVFARAARANVPVCGRQLYIRLVSSSAYNYLRHAFTPVIASRIFNYYILNKHCFLYPVGAMEGNHADL